MNGQRGKRLIYMMITKNDLDERNLRVKIEKSIGFCYYENNTILSSRYHRVYFCEL